MRTDDDARMDAFSVNVKNELEMLVGFIVTVVLSRVVIFQEFSLIICHHHSVGRAYVSIS